MSKYEITITADNDLEVTALRGVGAPKMTGGVGGWEEVSRPRDVALTEWRGRSPFRMSVPLLFDGFPDEAIEIDCVTLERMALPGGADQPPTVKLSGAVPHKDLKWIIDTFDWGDNVIYGTGGRIRQDVTVNLLQYVKEDRLKVKGGSRPTTHPKSYKVKKGDTLRKIAAKVYGDPNKASVIAHANGVRDGTKLKVGTTLRCP